MSFGNQKKTAGSTSVPLRNLGLSMASLTFFDRDDKSVKEAIAKASIPDKASYSPEISKRVKAAFNEAGVEYLDATFDGLTGRVNHIAKGMSKDNKVEFLKIGMRTADEQIFMSLPSNSQVADGLLQKLAGKTENGKDIFDGDVKFSVSPRPNEETGYMNYTVGLVAFDENGEKLKIEPVLAYEKGEVKAVKEAIEKSTDDKDVAKAMLNSDKKKRMAVIFEQAVKHLEEHKAAYLAAHPKEAQEEHEQSKVMPQDDEMEESSSVPTDFDDDIPF